MLAFIWEGLSPWHLLLLAAIALLFYGNRLPEVARSLGRAVNEFKRGLKDVETDVTSDVDSNGDSTRPRERLQAPPVEKRLEQEPAAQKPDEQVSEPQPEAQRQPEAKPQERE